MLHLFKQPRSEEGAWGLVPRRGMGWQPHRNPIAKQFKIKNQGAKRNLIPLPSHRAANPVPPNPPQINRIQKGLAEF